MALVLHAVTKAKIKLCWWLVLSLSHPLFGCRSQSAPPVPSSVTLSVLPGIWTHQEQSNTVQLALREGHYTMSISRIIDGISMSGTYKLDGSRLLLTPGKPWKQPQVSCELRYRNGIAVIGIEPWQIYASGAAVIWLERTGTDTDARNFFQSGEVASRRTPVLRMR